MKHAAVHGAAPGKTLSTAYLRLQEIIGVRTMREYLLTCENVSNYGEAVRRLQRLPRRVMLRIPIQWNDDEGHIDDPNDYVNAFRAFSAVADVMIQFADSSAMKHFTPGSFDDHVKHCLSVLGSFCKSAESGNEVNGDWLGKRTAEKVQRALTACSHANLPTVVTYYLSADDPRQMFDWIARHPLSSKYALISHYPNTTPGVSAEPPRCLHRVLTDFLKLDRRMGRIRDGGCER